ncbi:hypothetical protein PoB_003920700 [Plakobranchus ocellatus]|uniref:Integrase catalytic domain-containing protein n=1 Tax=Plakobranchus ocellatus TaxID=259542 RepID=A0AAV4B086_9GAST|nr:hypothetical protein PoB_003920700 [Plakobranchus ocellatus]
MMCRKTGQAPYNPGGNGICERFRSLQNLLCILSEQQKTSLARINVITNFLIQLHTPFYHWPVSRLFNVHLGMAPAEASFTSVGDYLAHRIYQLAGERMKRATQ